MQSVLTFIIPVRHQENAKDWHQLKRNLAQTVRSIAAQRSSAWNAVIVANQGADLPDLPKGFEVKWVDFPPNRLHEQGNADKETFYDAFRIDKGRRVLAGLLHAGTTGYVMIVDDDDFVSNRLASFVAENGGSPGWYLAQGYAWKDGGKLLYVLNDFHKLCGTSHIIRGDLYEVPPTFSDASESYIRQMLGSHIQIDGYLSQRGNALAPLPFYGAIYRIGHAGAHSKSKGIISQYILKKALLKNPVELIRRSFRIKFLSKSVQDTFFG